MRPPSTKLVRISTMLFILAMDPIQRVLDKATTQGLLQPIGADPIKLRTSLYANDVVQDMINLQQILYTNMQKSEMFTI